MDREDHRLGQGAEGRQDGFERGRRVGRGRPVSGSQHVAAGPHAELREDRLLALGRERRHGEIEHDVAGLHDARDDALASEVGHGRVGRAEEQARDVIGEHAVDLFGHAPVERAQTRFDVGDRHVQLGRGERSGQCRVRVAVDQHDLGSHLDDGGGDARQHGRRLAGVTVGAHPELDVGSRQVELVVEDAGQLTIVMLAGVEQHLAGHRAHRARHDRRLDVLRPIADDGEHDPGTHGRSLTDTPGSCLDSRPGGDPSPTGGSTMRT